MRSPKSKRELVATIRPRYKKATGAEKGITVGEDPGATIDRCLKRALSGRSTEENLIVKDTKNSFLI